MVLLIGATGIVGSHILAELLAQHARVRVLLRENSNRQVIQQLLSFRNLNSEGIEYAEGDMLDPCSIHDAMAGCTEVYHCAARVSFRPQDKNMLYNTNVHGTANVVDACLVLGVKKLCYISSTAAIGDQAIDGQLTEESIWTSDKGRSGYSISKRYAELEVWRGKQEGLNTVIVNPGVIIGSGNWGESSTSILLSCKNGMRFYPSGGNGFVAAKDVAKFCVESMGVNRFDQRYLLIGENLSFKELFSKITTAFDTPGPAIALPYGLVRPTQTLLKVLDVVGINPFSMSSENLDSAYRKISYSNERSLTTGFRYSSIDEAIFEAIEIYKRTLSVTS